ncbi:MAG TPA: hypothetical protein VF690_21585 [Hymenobacter sp.]|jgi:hypothetical protein
MNKTRLTPDSNPELDNRPVADLLASLSKTQGFGKAQVLFALSRRSHSMPELMRLVLSEVVSVDNQTTIAQFNDSVATAAAFAVVDDGQPADIEALKRIIDEWQNPNHSEDFYWSLKSADLTI